MSGESGELTIASERDMLASRRQVRELATKLGFRLTDVTRIVTASSELARNILRHGGGEGVVRWRVLTGATAGLELTFEDEGPGIEDVARAMEEGFTTSPQKSLGMGLPGSNRLMDDMRVHSEPGRGTKIVVRKYLRGKR